MGTERTTGSGARYDATLRRVMWQDAFWSVAFVLVGLVALPVMTLGGVPEGARLGVGVTALVAAVFLAACGAVTGVLLMLRMRAGHYYLPVGLRVPLPGPLRPDFAAVERLDRTDRAAVPPTRRAEGPT